MRPCHFSFDGETTFEGQTDDTRWNGFLNVSVTEAERDKIVGWLRANDDDPEAIEDLKGLPVDERGLVSLANGYATMEAETPVLDGEARFTLDGEPTDIQDFMEANDFDEGGREEAEILAMKVGEELTYGGGAAPVRVLRRTA
jgi:hypothetical protein